MCIRSVKILTPRGPEGPALRWSDLERGVGPEWRARGCGACWRRARPLIQRTKLGPSGRWGTSRPTRRRRGLFAGLLGRRTNSRYIEGVLREPWLARAGGRWPSPVSMGSVIGVPTLTFFTGLIVFDGLTMPTSLQDANSSLFANHRVLCHGCSGLKNRP